MIVKDHQSSHLDHVSNFCTICNHFISIRQNTIWSGKHISLETCFHLLVAFKSKASISVASREWGVSTNSVGKLFYEFKSLLVNYMHNPYVIQMRKFTEIDYGIYEIDESEVVKVKTPGGIKKQWIFGIYERATGKVFLQRIPNRRASTLIPIIKAHVPFWAVVITDSLKSYNSLKKRYFHYSVNHNIGDYSHQDKLPLGQQFTVTTNDIEQIWCSFKGPLAKTTSMKEIDYEILQIEFHQLQIPFEHLVKYNKDS